jgi:hypothetical protein
MRSGVDSTIVIIYAFNASIYIIRVVDHARRLRARASSDIVTEAVASYIIGIAPAVARRYVLAVVIVRASGAVRIRVATSITGKPAVVLVESRRHTFALTFFLAFTCMHALVTNLIFSWWAGVGTVGDIATLHVCEVIIAVA